MLTEAERADVGAELNTLDATGAEALRNIRATARRLTEAGNDQQGRDLTHVANQLSKLRTKAALARDKMLLTQSLAGPIAALRGLSAEAAQARQDLENVAKALEAAQRLVDIFRRVLGIFS